MFTAALAVLAFSSPPDFAPPEPPPTPIVGGQAAPTCGWPSAVQLANNFGEPFCTGSLVDERTVLTAAHCIDPAYSSFSADQILFGENAFSPESSIPIASCVLHPDWDLGSGEANDSFFSDLGVCTLAADALGVPIVPPLMGCEADALVAGGTVTIVGYGIDDEPGGSGAGFKRFTTQTIQTVDAAVGDLTLLGDGDSSACYGDSGGPAYIQLPDGTWRIAGVASTAHPDVWNEPQVCGYGVVYELIHDEMSWFEGQTGRDITPCHDADGTWNPDERCDAFPTNLTPPGLSWGAQCQGGAVSGPGESCGDAFDEDPPPDTDGGDGDTTDGPPGGETSGTDSNSSGNDPDDGGDTSGGGSGGSNDDESASGDLPGGTESGPITGWPGESRDEDEEGCGCHQPNGGGAWALFGLALGLVRRRRPPTTPG